MNENTFKLKLQSHTEAIKESLKGIKDYPELADVTLISEDQVMLKAHKLMLSMFSPVFRSLLGLTSEGKTVIHMRGTRGRDIQHLLDYIYCGEVTLDQDNVSSFLDLANSFKIQQLGNGTDTYHDSLKKSDNVRIVKAVEDIPMVNEQVADTKGHSEEESTQDQELTEDTINVNKQNQKAKECKESPIITRTETSNHFAKSSHAKVSESSVSCKKCDKVFDTAVGFQIHFSAQHMDENLKSILCSQCDGRFSSKHLLKFHMLNMHEERKHKCDQCLKTFALNAQKTRHIKIAHNSPMLQCDQCDKMYRDNANLKKHISSVHDKRRHECDKCDANFATYNALKVHERNKHLNIKYPCEFCGHQATQRTSLLTHIAGVHDKVRFPCQVCGANFSQKGTLNNHIKKVHGETTE